MLCRRFTVSVHFLFLTKSFLQSQLARNTLPRWTPSHIVHHHMLRLQLQRSIQYTMDQSKSTKQLFSAAQQTYTNIALSPVCAIHLLWILLSLLYTMRIGTENNAFSLRLYDLHLRHDKGRCQSMCAAIMRFWQVHYFSRRSKSWKAVTIEVRLVSARS